MIPCRTPRPRWDHFAWADNAVMHVEPSDSPSESPGDVERIVPRTHCKCCEALEGILAASRATTARLSAEIERLRKRRRDR